MRKSSKVACVALGMLLSATVVLVVALSNVYSPWRPYGSTMVCYGPPRGFRWWIVRYQKNPWLLGSDTQMKELQEDEYADFVRGYEP